MTIIPSNGPFEPPLVALGDMIDHQLGVSSNDQAPDSKPCCGPETSEQAFVLRVVVGGLNITEEHLDYVRSEERRVGKEC